MTFRKTIAALLAMAAAPSVAMATVTDVHLFPGGAEITHTIDATGKSRVTINELPDYLGADDIYIESATLLDFTLERTETTGDASHQDDILKLEALAEEIALLEEHQANHLSILERARAATWNGEHQANIEEFFSRTASLLSKTTEQLDRIQVDIKERRKEHDALKRRIQESTGHNKRRKHLTIETLGAEREVKVTYRSRGVFYHMDYDINFDSSSDDLEIRPRFNINQSTGSDWDQVNVSISTFKPSRRLNAPELPKRYAEIPRPAPRPAAARYENQSFGASRKMMSMDAAAEASANMASYDPGPQANITEHKYAVTYNLRDLLTLASNGQPKAVPMDVVALNVMVTRTLAPRVSQQVFMTAKADIPESVALLPGRAKLRVDGMMIGHQHIPFKKAGESFELGLGPDRGIKVEWDLSPQVSDEHMFGNRVTKTQTAALTITNHHSDLVQIEINERMPLAKNDEIEIELQGPDAKSSKPDDLDPQKITWKRSLAGGEIESVNWAITVTGPENLNIWP